MHKAVPKCLYFQYIAIKEAPCQDAIFMSTNVLLIMQEVRRVTELRRVQKCIFCTADDNVQYIVQCSIMHMNAESTMQNSNKSCGVSVVQHYNNLVTKSLCTVHICQATTSSEDVRMYYSPHSLLGVVKEKRTLFLQL